MIDDLRRVLGSRRWLAFAIVVAVLVPSAIRLGFWQVDRLEERRATNAIWGVRLDAAPVPLEAILDAGNTLPSEQRRYLRVAVEGTFLAGEQVLIRNRSLDGQSGSWVVTPITLETGSVLAVVRGWVPLGVTDPFDPVLDPPSGRVALDGVLVPGERPVAFGPSDPVEGRLTRLALLDLDRLGVQVGAPLGQEFVQQTSDEKGVELPPELLELPDVEDEGSHLAYAIQWFSFAIIGAIGFLALVRREAARLRRVDASALEVVEGPHAEE